MSNQSLSRYDEEGRETARQVGGHAGWQNVTDRQTSSQAVRRASTDRQPGRQADQTDRQAATGRVTNRQADRYGKRNFK